MTKGATSVGRSTARSAELFERARRVLVDGVSSPSRGPLNFRPYPLFMTDGEGGEMVDADGNRYVDLMLGFGALIHGHAHPRLVAALRDASTRGALLATIEHGVHEHPFLLLAARTSDGDRWSLVELAGLSRRPRAGVRLVIASAAALVVGHFAPEERVARLWLRLADGTGDVADRVDDAVLVIAAVGDIAAASPGRLEYLAADGAAVTSEDIAIGA